MKRTSAWRKARAVLARLWTEDAGVSTVDYAILLGVVVMVAAVIFAPKLTEFVTSLISHWHFW